MNEDFDDTVIVPQRTPQPTAVGPDLERTIIGRIDPMPDDAATAPGSSPSIPQNFYSFTVGGHSQVIVLDVPCILGRRPSLPRVIRGTAPRLVRVPSPLKEVSSTHLEIRQVGSSIVVTDLRSTNGSVVTIPGSVPRKLRQGESVVVSPGTRVDIGDGNILTMLPMSQGSREALGQSQEEML